MADMCYPRDGPFSALKMADPKKAIFSICKSLRKLVKDNLGKSQAIIPQNLQPQLYGEKGKLYYYMGYQNLTLMQLQMTVYEAQKGIP